MGRRNGRALDDSAGQSDHHQPPQRCGISGPGSKTADVTAEFVCCGRSRDKLDYAGKNVAGKIVLISGLQGSAAALAMREFGAAGVVSSSNATGKPVDRTDQIAWGSAGSAGTYAFNVSHRLGMELVERLDKGDMVAVRARVKATEYEAGMQVPTAIIRRDGNTDQEVVLAAHLFERAATQGAIDNGSGSAPILEVARAWICDATRILPKRPSRPSQWIWLAATSTRAASASGGCARPTR